MLNHLLKTCWLLLLMSCRREEPIQADAPPERYRQQLFTGVLKTTVLFDSPLDHQGITKNLWADLYQPEGDTATQRAALVFVHGGGFVGGTRDGSNIPYLCESLAQRGYVVASIDYRLGILDNASPQLIGQAQLRAVQDLKSFLRFAKGNAEAARIDPARIFLVGSSAGAGTVLAAAFLDDHEQPAYLDTTGVGGLAGRGNLNGQNTAVKAVYSLWGGVVDTLWIQAGDVPVGAIQSIQSIHDPCIPWNSSASSSIVPNYPLFGSNSIHARAKNLGIHTALHGFDSDQHDLGLTFPHLDTTIAKMTAFFYPLTR